MRPRLKEDGIDKWTFGQVMAPLVVIAHIITATEGYIKSQSSKGLVRTIESEVNKQPAMSHNFRNRNHIADTVDGIKFPQTDSRAPSSLIGLGTKPTNKTDDFLTPHPAHDYYSSCFSFPILEYSTLCSTATVSGLLITSLRT